MITCDATTSAAALTAANGAAAGEKRSAAAAAVVSEIGSGPKLIQKDGGAGGTTKTDLTLTGSMTYSTDGVITIPTAISATNTNTSFTVSSDDVLRIEKSGDSTRYIMGSLGLSGSGADFELTSSPDGSKTFVISTIRINMNAIADIPASTGGTVIPVTDNRSIAAWNPTLTLQDMHSIWPTTAMGMIAHPTPSIAALGNAFDQALDLATDPVHYDQDGSVKFGRVADPLNASRRVYIHRTNSSGRWRAQGAQTDSSNIAYRASLQPEQQTGTGHGAVVLGDTIVFAVDVLLAADSVILGSTGTGFLLWSLHHWSGSKTSATPFYGQLEKFPDDSGTPRFRFVVEYNPDDYSYGALNGAYRPDSGHNYKVTLWETSDLAAMRANWHTFIFYGKHSPNLSDNPFTQLWLRVGNGALTKVKDLTGQPWGYKNNTQNGVNFLYPQLQHYCYWGTSTFGATTSRSWYSRGMHCWRVGAGTPDITVANALATIDGIGA